MHIYMILYVHSPPKIQKRPSRPGKEAAGAWMPRSSCRGHSTLALPVISGSLLWKITILMGFSWDFHGI